jgi:hypothetical protein
MARWERYLARVVANNDEAKRGRIRVVCSDFTGDPDKQLPIWIEPAYDWGWFVVPDVDELVEIEVLEQQDTDDVPGQSSVINPVIKWRQKREYHSEEIKDGLEKDAILSPTPVHEDFTATNYGKRRGFATPNGHVLMFDDTDGGQQINLTWHALEGDEDKYSFLSFDPTGSIILGNKTGSLIYMNAEAGEVSIIDEHGNLISSNADGMKMIDKTGNVVELKDQLVQVLGQGSVVINCKTAQLKAGAVELGDAADTPVVRGDDWKAWAEAHTHPTGVGPSGPPTEPILPTVLSTVVKTK